MLQAQLTQYLRLTQLEPVYRAGARNSRVILSLHICRCVQMAEKAF
jgi:uncharacterized membrane protein